MPETPATTAPSGPPQASSPSSEPRVCPGLVEEVALACSRGPVCLLAEPCAEGVLAATGLSYLARAHPGSVRLEAAGLGQPRLGEASFEVPADPALAERVLAGFLRHTRGLGSRSMPAHVHGPREAVSLVAAMVEDPSMPEALHRYLRAGFAWGPSLGDHGSDPWVARAEALATQAASELEHTRQFVRFSRMADGGYLAVFRPKADVVPLSAGYFRRRMGGERFCVLDPRHGSAVLCEHGRVALVRLGRDDAEAVAGDPGPLAAGEAYVRALWKGFYDAVALGGRGPETRGYDLRRQFMPKRLWTCLPELDPSVDTAWTFVPEAYRGSSAPGAAAAGPDGHGLPEAP